MPIDAADAGVVTTARMKGADLELGVEPFAVLDSIADLPD